MSPPGFLGDPCVHALLFDPGGSLHQALTVQVLLLSA
jgi:hypothetical protein